MNTQPASRTVDIFIIMPSGNKNEYTLGPKESDFVFDEIIKLGIQQAINDIDLEVSINRELDKNKPGSISKSIIQHLATADIVIADITGQNPNVFLELGVRYSLRSRGTLLMTQKPNEIPFDIFDYRSIIYDPYKPAMARQDIANFVREVLTSDDHASDSVVFDTFRDLSVRIPNILESHGLEVSASDRDILSWSEYNERIQYVTSILEGPMKDGRYNPDAIIGISNGGYIVADLIGRRLFTGKPILGLWAHRIAPSGPRYRFFENPHNAALCLGLRNNGEAAKSGDELKIVLVDDHFGSGSTFEQAKGYLQSQLGDDINLLFIPLVTGRIEGLKAFSKFLPFSAKSENGDKIFNVSENEFLDRVYTTAKFFPYLKKQINQS